MFAVAPLSYCSDVRGVESTVEVDVEVRTELINNISCRDEMANTKQTKRKQDNDGRQGSPAKFPRRGKPGGKAAKHMAARNDDSSDENSSGNESQSDNNNNTVQGTVRAGRRRRQATGKACIYKRPTRVSRKYRPGVGTLKEMKHYQRESGQICSRLACARLFHELCQKVKEGLRWQASAIIALQEGFEDYFVTLFHDTVLAAIHGRRVTVMPKNIHLVCQLRGETDPYAGSVSLQDIPRRKKHSDEFDKDGNRVY